MNLRIKEICEQKNVSIAELGRLIGAAKSSIHTIINNGNPTAETLSKIANALNVEIAELFESPKRELTALIQHRGDFYKANTISELEKIVEKIKEKAG